MKASSKVTRVRRAAPVAIGEESSKPAKLHILVFEPGRDPYVIDIEHSDAAIRSVLGDRVNCILQPEQTIGLHCAFHGDVPPDWDVTLVSFDRRFKVDATGVCFAAGTDASWKSRSITAKEIARVKKLVRPMAVAVAETSPATVPRPVRSKRPTAVARKRSRHA